MAYDVETITRKGAELLASATTADKLVIAGCDATTIFISQSDALNVSQRPAQPFSNTTNANLEKSTTNHVFVRVFFVAGQSTGGDVRSLYIYGHSESDPTHDYVLAVLSSVDTFHLPIEGDISNTYGVLFDIIYNASSDSVTTASSSVYATYGEYADLRDRVVTTHKRDLPTTGDNQTIYGIKTFAEEIKSTVGDNKAILSTTRVDTVSGENCKFSINPNLTLRQISGSQSIGMYAQRYVTSSNIATHSGVEESIIATDDNNETWYNGYLDLYTKGYITNNLAKIEFHSKYKESVSIPEEHSIDILTTNATNKKSSIKLYSGHDENESIITSIDINSNGTIEAKSSNSQDTLNSRIALLNDHLLLSLKNSETFNIKYSVSNNTASLYPMTSSGTITYDLGTPGNKWNNVYANTFNGNLIGNVTGNINGNATYATTAGSATTADSATTAGSATHDSNGKDITRYIRNITQSSSADVIWSFKDGTDTEIGNVDLGQMTSKALLGNSNASTANYFNRVGSLGLFLLEDDSIGNWDIGTMVNGSKLKPVSIRFKKNDNSIGLFEVSQLTLTGTWTLLCPFFNGYSGDNPNDYSCLVLAVKTIAA